MFFPHVLRLLVPTCLIIFIDSICSSINKWCSYFSQLIDVSILPGNIFNLKGNVFYTLVPEVTSNDIENLLKVQRISSARCFLNTNPLTCLDLQADEPSIIKLQARLSYRTADGQKDVLAGIVADILCLKQLLTLFLMTDEKKRISCTDSTATAERPSSIITRRTTSSRISVVRSGTNELSIDDHRKYLNRKIKSWWEKDRNDYKLENYVLI